MGAEHKTDQEREREQPDEVTEAGLESFPASDPPAFTPSNADREPENAPGRDTRDDQPGAETRHQHAAEEREQRIAAERRAAEHAAAPDPVKSRASTSRLVGNAVIVVIVLAALIWLIFG